MNIPLLKKQEENNLEAIGGQPRKAASHFMFSCHTFLIQGGGEKVNPFFKPRIPWKNVQCGKNTNHGDWHQGSLH